MKKLFPLIAIVFFACKKEQTPQPSTPSTQTPTLTNYAILDGYTFTNDTFFYNSSSASADTSMTRIVMMDTANVTETVWIFTNQLTTGTETEGQDPMTFICVGNVNFWQQSSTNTITEYNSQRVRGTLTGRFTKQTAQYDTIDVKVVYSADF